MCTSQNLSCYADVVKVEELQELYPDAVKGVQVRDPALSRSAFAGLAPLMQRRP